MKTGILNKASSAKIETEKARVEEVVKLAVNEAVLNEMSTIEGKIDNITAQDILDIVQKNENKTDGISYLARTEEGAVEPRNLPCYIVFDKKVTSIKQTIKVPVDLSLNVGTAIIDGEEQETNYEEMAKEEIKEIIKDIGDGVTPQDIVNGMKNKHPGANISSKSNTDTDTGTFPCYIVIPSKTYGEDQLEELRIAVNEDKEVGNGLYTTTPEGYIPIYTKAELKEISSGAADAKYILMADISLADEEWTPIAEFKASELEGNDKTISGMKMTITQSGNYGLFNQLSSGTIQNLNMKNISINEDWSAPGDKWAYVGGIAGRFAMRTSKKLQNIWKYKLFKCNIYRWYCRNYWRTN